MAKADTVKEKAPTLLNKLGAEAFGTFVLVFGVIGTALFSSSNTGFLGVAVAIGLAVIAAAYTVGRVSGGHFNPAVTIGLAAAGKFDWKDVPGYAIAQFIGGLVATLVLFAIKPEADFAAVSNGYQAEGNTFFPLLSVLIVEIVLTALLVAVILGTTARDAEGSFAPLAIGFTLVVIHLVAIPISNASVNPARSLATAVFGGGAPLEQLWAFFVAPIVGGILAGTVFRVLKSK